MCNETKLYKNYERMINMKSLQIANQFRRDLNETRSLVLDIFRRAVEDYEPQLGKFSTYFNYALKAIHNISVREIETERVEVSLQSEIEPGLYYEDIIPDNSHHMRSMELSQSADVLLSTDAKRVLDGIYTGIFEAGRSTAHLAGKQAMYRYLLDNWKWNHSRAKRAIGEVEDWYKSEVV